MPCACCDCACTGCTVSEYVVEDNLDANGDGLYRQGIVGSTLPPGGTYAEGYPDALDNCLWFWWNCNNNCQIVISEGPPKVFAGTYYQSQRLFVCKGGQLKDITDKATIGGPFLQGPINTNGGAAGNTSIYGATPCPDGPTTNFLDPVIVCQ